MSGPTIDRALVLHVAKLASLNLTEGEVDRFTLELSRIVGHIEQLGELDTREVEPTAHVMVDRMPLREDSPTPSLSREEALAGAPLVEGDGFAVPAFVE